MAVQFKAAFEGGSLTDFGIQGCFGEITTRNMMEKLTRIIIRGTTIYLKNDYLQETIGYIGKIPRVISSEVKPSENAIITELSFEKEDSTVYKFLMMCLAREFTYGFSFSETKHNPVTLFHSIIKDGYKPQTPLGLIAYTNCDLLPYPPINSDNHTWQIFPGDDAIRKINSYWGLQLLHDNNEYGNWFVTINMLQTIKYFPPEILEDTPDLISFLESKGA